MSLDSVISVMEKFRNLGCRAVTITGGGEPLIHPDINTILRAIRDLEIEIGLVTNGTLFDKLRTKTLDTITWCRVSLADYRKFEKIEKSLEKTVERGGSVDWSFSYVAGKDPNITLIQKMIQFANEYDFTHIRLVNDIFIADQLEGQMKIIKAALKNLGTDDSKVIYQTRAIWTRGTKKCWISLLKPVVAADGNLYPCCGSQYMFKNPKRDYEGKMGSVDKIEEIWASQKYFDGSRCYKCYYNHYNELLDVLLSTIKHEKFV